MLLEKLYNNRLFMYRAINVVIKGGEEFNLAVEEERLGVDNPWAYAHFLVGVYAIRNRIQGLLNKVDDSTPLICWDMERVPREEVEIFSRDKLGYNIIESWVSYGGKYATVKFNWRDL